jgi:hypothetical protein
MELAKNAQIGLIQIKNCVESVLQIIVIGSKNTLMSMVFVRLAQLEDILERLVEVACRNHVINFRFQIMNTQNTGNLLSKLYKTSSPSKRMKTILIARILQLAVPVQEVTSLMPIKSNACQSIANHVKSWT